MTVKEFNKTGKRKWKSKERKGRRRRRRARG